ncbi:MAG: hypothetical protein KDB01_02810 [Planctomycetaceae bacterium]|nr:hypothetical protein [Planctomycetaceae bacterium]
MLSPIPAFSRLVVTGNDRAKYLHNFCTNQVRELPAGSACEAFFCDVKARVIAHGYVLAFEDCHEIWMLAGNEAGILQHLNRYIITEDVTIHSATASTCAMFAVGPATTEALLRVTENPDSVVYQPLTCARLQFRAEDNASAAVSALSIVWADTPLLWLALPTDGPDILAHIPTHVDVDAAQRSFEELRIRERFPLVGQDLTTENMAPEAERNKSAISYVKGCYLGQEPIARLDAMGHVNRALRCVESSVPSDQLLQATVLASDDVVAGVVTSAVPVQEGAIGLAMIRASAIHVPLHSVIEGQVVTITISRPRNA